jgi:hypothetical protein
MGGFHKPDKQGKLIFFPEDVPKEQYFDFSTLINPELLIQFMDEFKDMAINVEKYEVGLFIRIVCKVKNVYLAGKMARKYFTYKL